MSASSAPSARGLAATALAKASAWLVEPAESPPTPVDIPVRPSIAAVGLAAGCGCTTVARALAVELAARDPSGAAAVAGETAAATVPFRSATAGRLARALGEPEGAGVRTAGRLCLVTAGQPAQLATALRHLAPLVLDVSHGAAPGVPASLADHVVLVATPEVEPALAAVVAASLARVGPEPFVVLNRAEEPGAWADRVTLMLGDSRAGAQLALAGRDARGRLGQAIGELADACEAVASTW